MDRWRKPAAALFLLAWFAYFSRDGLRAHFAPDDMMNIDSFYWTPGPWRLLYAQALIWRGYYRPMGGLFYLPILAGWGLNPLPYHIVLSLILLANVYLLYRLCRLIGCGELAAALAGLGICYHAGLSNLYYNTAYVYDALCAFFSLAALVCYCRVRAAGRLPGRGGKIAFVALYVCAMNSKEMALALPGVLLAYEWVYHPPKGPSRRDFGEWLQGPGWTALFAAALALLDLWGKVFGFDRLAGAPGYTPAFTLERFREFQITFLRDVFLVDCRWGGILLFWAVVSYLAFRPGARPVLRFCWWWMVLTALPIEFLPGKSQACLYLPAIGAAVFAAVVFRDLADLLAGLLVREPLFRRVARGALMAGLILIGLLYWGRANQYRKILYAKPVMAALGQQTWEVIQQFRAVHPQVRPHSHVVFLHDPFQDWDMLFIADLWFRDRTVNIRLNRLTPLSPEELAKADYLLDYRDGKLIPVRF